MPLAAGQYEVCLCTSAPRLQFLRSALFSPWRYRPGPRLLERVRGARGASEPGPEGPKGWELRGERQGLTSPYWALEAPGRRTDRALHCIGMGCGHGMGPCGAVTPSPTPSLSQSRLSQSSIIRGHHHYHHHHHHHHAQSDPPNPAHLGNHTPSTHVGPGRAPPITRRRRHGSAPATPRPLTCPVLPLPCLPSP
jgi:hypothetical protein